MKIQLINEASSFKTMKKSLGSKRKYIDEPQRANLLKPYENFEENEFSKIFDKEFFGYNKITIEQPLKENGKISKDKKGALKPNSKLRDY